MSRGCVFFNFGDAYALRLLVSVFTLRQVYDGPITVFLARDEAGDALRAELEQLSCDVTFVDVGSKSGDRHRVLQQSPYATTLSFDSDLIFRRPIDELWAPLEREGLLVTRFFPNPHGVDGTPAAPGWADRLGYLRGVRHLVDDDTYVAAEARLLEDRIDVNVGVMGIARPAGDAFLTDWSARMERGRAEEIALLDEMLVVALLVDHRHALVDERWNCPADEFFRRTNLADAHVIHYFADGHRVHGLQLGRNRATWAGMKWYEAHDEAAEVVDLRRWQGLDPTFARPTSALRSTTARASRLATRKARGARRRLHRAIRRPGRRGLRQTLGPLIHRAQQQGLAVLARLGYRVGIDVPARATVILLSYKRMENIPAIVRSALLCGFVDRVVVSNNNPDVDLTTHLPVDDPRLELVQQDERRRPSYRYDLAREHPSDYYICIDDDVFPNPWQLRRMLRALFVNPASPRGMAGQIYDERRDELVRTPPAPSAGDQQADVLLHTYVFTRAHLDRYFDLLGELGRRNDDVHSSEDVILSFAGADRPLVSGFRFVYECPTAGDPEIATYRGEGVHRARHELYREVRAAC